MTRRRRFSLPLLLLAALAVPTALAADAGGVPHRDPAAVDRLMTATNGKAKMHVDGATATASSVSIPPGLAGTTPGNDLATMRGKSKDFLRQHGRVVGVTDADNQLRDAGESVDRLGQAHFKYEQVYQGVPVFGAVLKTHFDASGELRAVTGKAVPDVAVDPNPTVSADAAGKTAVAEVQANPRPSSAPDDGVSSPASPAITSVGSRLLVYRTGFAQGVPGENFLAWEIEVGNGLDVREFVYVDAHTGKVIDRITGIYDGMYRRAYNGLNLNGIPPSYPGSPFWVEGDPFPSGIAEADNMLISSNETYNFYFNTFGRDSFDGHGAKMDQIFNRGYSCPNASWNGTFISFCPGLTTDDVTAHEWSHAYTQYTHGLIYQWQSGALNESYSDIWGEIVDRINGRGTDVHGHRTDGLCSSFYLYPPIVRVNSPAAIAGDYASATASFGPAIVGTGITGNLALAQPAGACTALTNPADVAGKIAIVDRGVCAFTIKVKNAQLAGAIGVIVADNVAGPLAGMSGVDPTITIPSLRVTLATGNTLKSQLGAGVNATLRTVEPPVTDHVVTWMLGEDDTAPGLAGPLRDMWNPPCAGNPGKVSDPLYSCSTADSGGVHNNSGVPNHAFALLVDGGTYNGHTNTGIGLTKAAHIYWRAQTVYQTPGTNFADHEFAVTQACNDLIGAELTELGTGNPSSEVITAADCAQIPEVMAAVEMSNPPAQCGFVPILNPNPPGRCAAGSAEVRVFQDDFEAGPGNWAVSRQDNPLFTPRDWTWVQTLPSRRTGAAFFAPNPTIGLCTATSNETGVLHLDSPAITLASGVITPSLTFDHWVATEAGFDGGNLKVSVNGGPWQVVAPADYTFNPPNRTLNTAAQNNSNPMGGQPAFSGNNPGDVGGSWGRSHVNLTPYAHPGDTVKLRFDLGCDCGGGRFGWYVDDTVLYQCVSDAAPAVSIGDATLAEGNDGFFNLTFTVSLSAPTTRTVTVHYKTGQGTATPGGSASPGTDYLPVDGDLTFAGSTLNTKQTVTVRIKGDTRREANEYFFVNLSNPVNVTIGDGQGQGNILNDD